MRVHPTPHPIASVEAVRRLRLGVGVALVVGLLVCTYLTAVIPPRPDPLASQLGSWHGEHHGRQVSFTFFAEGRVEIEVSDTHGSYLRVFHGRYRVDPSKIPTPLTIYDVPTLPYDLHTTLRLRGDGIELAGFSPEWRLRPIAFPPEDTLWLRR